MSFESIKGTRDILPEETKKWVDIEKKIREVCRRYNYKEIRVPTFERAELFSKSTGKDTDIVQKEMYTFKDKGGRNLALKPEGTPSVVRAYLEHGLSSKAPFHKLFYIERMFRQERPQKGRWREFSQFGVEALGSKSPYLDVEIILLGMDFFRQIGLSNVEVHINSIGCSKCRPNYKKHLREYLSRKLPELCDDCKRKFKTNPLRILDCKVDRQKLKDAPHIYDFLCKECKDHFDAVVSILKKQGVKIVMNHNLVRGLDYYTKTVFEYVVSSLGAQNAVGGGGRYDDLVKIMGGKDTPAAGFAIGLDRVVLAMKDKDVVSNGIDFFVVTIGEKTEKIGFSILQQLRNIGFSGEKDFTGRSIKAQMRYANKSGAKYVIIIGEDELRAKKVRLKNMKTGSEEDVILEEGEIARRISEC